jgi:hypothetical protein
VKNTKRQIGMLGAALLGAVAVFGTALPSSAQTRREERRDVREARREVREERRDVRQADTRAERREEREELRDARGNLRRERRDVRQTRRNGNPPYGNAYGYRRNRVVRSSTVYNRYGYNYRGYNRAGRYNARFDQRR